MAQESRAVNIKYDEQSAQQRAKLAATHSSNVQRYEGLRAAADAAYQKLKAEAYINKALSDLAGGPAPASMTHRQRGMSALLKEVGAAERQRRDYSREIDLALKNLNAQHAADLAYADAMNEACREAERLQRSQFDAEMGLQRDYFELDKRNRTFDRMYKLYTSRRIDKDAFRDATGYAIKAMPAPKRKKKAQPMVRFVGSKEPAKTTPGYVLMPVYHVQTGAKTYYEVEENAARAMKEKGISLQDVSGQVRSEPELYAIGRYEGFAGADVGTQVSILEANKKDFTQKYGEDAYKAFCAYIQGGPFTGKPLPQPLVKHEYTKPDHVPEGYMLVKGGNSAKPVYVEVRTDMAEAMQKKNISVLDRHGHVTSLPRLYAETKYEGFADAGYAKQREILEANKEDFAEEFGEWCYELFHDYYQGMAEGGRYFSEDDQSKVSKAFNNILGAAGTGGDVRKAIQDYQKAFNKGLENLVKSNDASGLWSIVESIDSQAFEQFRWVYAKISDKELSSKTSKILP